MSDIVERLREGLKLATGGQWTIEPHGDGEVLYAGRGPNSHGLNLVYLREGDWNWQHNRRHIANCSPDNIAALLEEIVRLRAERDRLRDALTEVVEAWDWWNVDTYDRCSSVVADAVREARAALKGDTP